MHCDHDFSHSMSACLYAKPPTLVVYCNSHRASPIAEMQSGVTMLIDGLVMAGDNCTAVLAVDTCMLILLFIEKSLQCSMPS